VVSLLCLEMYITHLTFNTAQLEKIGLYKRPTYSAPKHYTSASNNGGAARAGGAGYNTIV
jgi:hypothetical protein